MHRRARRSAQELGVMPDLQLTFLAATAEVGLAALVVLAVVFGKSVRNRAVVILGAITPAIIAMGAVVYWQFINPTPGSMAGAEWIMGFAAYAFLWLGGLAVSFVPRPSNLYGRYALGLATAPVSFALLSFL